MGYMICTNTLQQGILQYSLYGNQNVSQKCVRRKAHVTVLEEIKLRYI
jgi:hypothetical protein